MKSKDKKKDNALEQAQINYYNRLSAADTATAKPDPLTEMLRAESMGFLEDTSGKNGPVDITKARGFGAETGLFNAAVNAQEEDTDIGAVGFDLGSANPLAMARIKENMKDRRQQRAAGALENAYRTKRAEITGSTAPFVINTDMSRNMGRLGQFNQGYQNTLNAWANFVPRPSIFEGLLNSAARGVGAAVSAYATGGLSRAPAYGGNAGGIYSKPSASQPMR